MNESLEVLRTRIESNLIESTSQRENPEHFIPKSSLKATLARSVIEATLKGLSFPREDHSILADAIENDGIITFSILIYARQPNAIIDFWRHDRLDAQLPLNEAEAISLMGQTGTTFSELYQWKFLPHKFRRNLPYQRIDSRKVLPFIKSNPKPLGSGGFGTIFQEEIHPSLQDFYPEKDNPIIVVRKRLDCKTSAEKYDRIFENEKKFLRYLGRLRHPNIIQLLASYSYRAEHNFLFPMYAMDLKKFLKQPGSHGHFAWNFTFFSAMHGLASALSAVHNLRLQAGTHGFDFEGIGYHHDVRPANILVSEKTLILADFGLGKLKPDDQLSTTPWKAGAGDYLAPECMDEHFNHQDVGRSIDVWAFGCLMTELVTFMNTGASGIESFLQVRLSPGAGGWLTSYFFDTQSQLKESVAEWLRPLLEETSCPAVSRPLHTMIIRILVSRDRGRPTATEITAWLVPLSVKATFYAVCDSMTAVIENGQLADGTSSMKFWFERERFKALGNALAFETTELTDSLPGGMEKHYSECLHIMLELFHLLRQDVEQQDGDAEQDPRNELDTPIYPTSSLIQQKEEGRAGVEVQAAVQKLWDLLPDTERIKAESIWVYSMIDTDDLQRLDDIERALSSETRRVYQEGAAMAVMKKIRLELEQSDLRAIQNHELTPSDISEIKTVFRHSFGTFRDGSTVMIEWMSYGPAWDNIPPNQQGIIMDYKVEGFNVHPKPENFSVLECIGFFERNDGEHGYGFVYRFPNLPPGTSSPQMPTTLLHLLLQSAKHATRDQFLNQPLLGDKYHLAYKLAGFLKEFHSIGWLHETFHSSNILFFSGLGGAPSINPDNTNTLREPYIVGLHKSRPGISSWDTQGPAADADFLVYRHPGYAVTKRFRLVYDYYSLGIMLLEIGLWYPAKGWRDKPEYRRLSHSDFTQELVKKYVPRLGPRMGRVYQDAVMLCITNGLDPQPLTMIPTKEDENNAAINFIENVFEPLQALSRAHI